MNLQITPFQEYTLVSVEGRIDTTNFSEFEKPIMTLIEGGCSKIILDCSGLNYISSSGLRVFLIIQKKMFVLGLPAGCSVRHHGLLRQKVPTRSGSSEQTYCDHGVGQDQVRTVQWLGGCKPKQADEFQFRLRKPRDGFGAEKPGK